MSKKDKTKVNETVKDIVLGIQLSPDDKELVLRLRSLQCIPVKQQSARGSMMIAADLDALVNKMPKMLRKLTTNWHTEIGVMFLDEDMATWRENAERGLFDAPEINDDMGPMDVLRIEKELYRKITSAYAVLIKAEPRLLMLQGFEDHFNRIVKALTGVDKEWQAQGIPAIAQEFRFVKELAGLEFVVNQYKLIIANLKQAHVMVDLIVRAFGKPDDTRSWYDQTAGRESSSGVITSTVSQKPPKSKSSEAWKDTKLDIADTDPDFD